MSVFDDAARTAFGDPNMSVAATYTSAAGTVTTLRVIYTQAADAVLGGGAIMGTIAQQDAAEILQSDVQDRPTRGATLALETGQTFKVGSLAEPAKRALIWRVVLTSG